MDSKRQSIERFSLIDVSVRLYRNWQIKQWNRTNMQIVILRSHHFWNPPVSGTDTILLTSDSYNIFSFSASKSYMKERSQRNILLSFDDTEMSVKLFSPAFVAVILFSVMCDYCLQAMQNDKGKQRRTGQDKRSEVLSTAVKNGASTSRGSTNCDEWNLDSIIQIEINGDFACVAFLLDERGCSTFSLIITVDGTLHTGIAAPSDCLKKVEENIGQVTFKTADDDKGTLTFVEPTKLNVIPGARKKLSSGTKGMTTVWEDGTLKSKEFVIVDYQNCDIHKMDSNFFFCAENAGKEKINAGEGAPFFLKLDGRQVAMGVQIEYSKTTGGNTYGAIKVRTLVKVPESELQLTSSGVFDFDSVIKVEQNGRHLCLACMFDESDTEDTTIFMPIECLDKVKENSGAVKYKTVKSEEFPLEVSDDNGSLRLQIRNPSNWRFNLKVNARLPIGTKGMAATWDKGNVIWKEFIVTDVADCGVDLLVIVLKYGTTTLDKFFCIKHVGGCKIERWTRFPIFHQSARYAIPGPRCTTHL